MITQQEWVLKTVLKCGTLDLPMLDDIQYDIGDIVDVLIEDDALSLNSILDEVFRQGQDDLQSAYDEVLAEMHIELEDNPDNAEIEAQIAELEALNIDADMRWYTNCLDTNVYLENLEIYRQYLESEIETIETNMGFSFS